MNDGNASINNLNIVVTTPEETKLVESFEKTNISMVSFKKNETIHNSKKEIIYSIKRIESEDKISLCFVLDFPNSIEKPQLSFRGVDNIDYTFKGADFKDASNKDIELALILVAGLVLAGMLPFAEKVVQAIIIFLGIPIFSRIISKAINYEKKSTTHNVTNIEGDLNVSKESNVMFKQGNS